VGFARGFGQPGSGHALRTARGPSLVDRAVIYGCWKATYDFGCRIAGIGDRHRPGVFRRSAAFGVPSGELQ
jgi:hypothetical protein